MFLKFLYYFHFNLCYKWVSYTLFDLFSLFLSSEFVALNKFLLKVQQAFSDLERGRGFLAPDEVYEALLKLDISMDSPAFYTVCESFDKEKNGKFRLDDFMSLCIFVQSARNLFNSFDTSKQGRVTLDLNQFIYCTANCRI
ncbi:putative EF-hand domain pair protein [Helianthus debilis subsp. tardiflorus]